MCVCVWETSFEIRPQKEFCRYVPANFPEKKKLLHVFALKSFE